MFGLLALTAAACGMFLLVARRRRRGDDEPARARRCRRPLAAAAPVVIEPMTAVVDEDLTPVDDDAPLKEVRKASKRATAAATAAAVATSVRTFGKPPPKGVERAMVGYRRVRISSEPDAVRSVELGRLDRGDEVEILDSHEGFLQVRTPDDITGWILRHTIVSATASSRRAGATSGAALASRGLRPAWIRARAPSQSGSSGFPGSSRSMTQRRVVGRDRRALARLAVDLGVHDPARRHRRRHEQVVDAHPEVLVEHAGAVVPPREAARLARGMPVAVGQPEVEQRPEGGPLGLRDVRAAVDRRGIPDVHRRSGRR